MRDIKTSENKKEIIEEVPLSTEEIILKRTEVESVKQVEEKLLEENNLKKKKQKRIKKILLFLFLLVILFVFTTAYSQYQIYIIKRDWAESLVHKVPETQTQIIEAVARHVLLPKTTPQIATVDDYKKLVKSQSFFKDVMNGDIVLVYNTIIVVYRPSVDIVVAIGDISSKSR